LSIKRLETNWRQVNHQRFGLEASPPSAPTCASPTDHDEPQVCPFSTSRPNKGPQDYAAEKRSKRAEYRVKSISGRHSPAIGIVPEDMGRDPPSGLVGLQLGEMARVTPDDLVDSEPRQRAPMTQSEDRTFRIDAFLFSGDLFEQVHGLLP
jgi:hypothetical protein